MKADLDIHVRTAFYSVDGKPILRGIDARFPAGSVTLLLGSNGSGKTMLLEMMAGLRKPDEGQVWIGGEPLWHGSKPDRRLLHRIGLAMQSPEQMLFARTVREEFAYSMKPFRWPADVQTAATRNALARWLDVEESWPARDPLALSGGEKRRLALSLIELGTPGWLLLDEPTAGLDQSTLELLLSRIAGRKAAGLGTIVVTHDPEEWMRIADQVLFLRDGEIVWSGTPAGLAETPAAFGLAGMDVPDRLKLIIRLRQAGFQLPAGWPEAEALAASVGAQLPAPALAAASPPETGRDPAPPPEADDTGDNPLRKYDPRALWLACLAVTAGIGMQSSWPGWLAGAAAAAAAIRFSGVPARIWWRPAKALLVFAFITSLAAGFQPQADEPFLIGTAVDTFRRFSKLAMIALIGFSLMAGISPLRLKRALETGLSKLSAIGLPVGRIALAAALLVRFLPLLVSSWDRFSRIAVSRGKRAVKPGTVPPALIPMTTMPFLLSMVRLGDDLSAILAVRGAGRPEGKTPPPRIPGVTPSFTRHDAFLLAAAFAVFAILAAIEKTA